MASSPPNQMNNKSECAFSTEQGYLPGACKDKQSITAAWNNLQNLITGVQIKEVKNVCKRRGGVLTEIFRQDWNLDNIAISQIFQLILQPNEISGWHNHQFTTDRIFVNWGQLRMVLYDARANSLSFGYINEFNIGSQRPTLILIPPGVWHAVQNNTNESSALINIVDKAYDYDDPDHWRLPIDTTEIPFKFT